MVIYQNVSEVKSFLQKYKGAITTLPWLAVTIPNLKAVVSMKAACSYPGKPYPRDTHPWE